MLFAPYCCSTVILRVLTVASALSVAACGDAPEPVSEQARAPQRVEVTVEELKPQAWQSTVSTFGVVEALEEVNVAAELSGTVTAVHINEGDRVGAGQLLLELDPQKRQFAVEQAQQHVQHAQAALKEAQLKLQLVSLVLLPVMYMVEQDVRVKLGRSGNLVS